MVQPHGRTLIDQPRQNRVRCPNKSRISREIARTSRVRRRSCATSMPERTERDARTRRSNRHIGPRCLAPEDSHGLICLRHHAPVAWTHPTRGPTRNGARPASPPDPGTVRWPALLHSPGAVVLPRNPAAAAGNPHLSARPERRMRVKAVKIRQRHGSGHCMSRSEAARRATEFQGADCADPGSGRHCISGPPAGTCTP